MTYEPREGVDYIVDLYAVAAVSQETAEDDLKRAINNRLKEYHPDRLEGLAPEFREKGERMARLLNRARVVLLNPEARSEYDEILDAWDKPVSKDGTPVITVGRYSRAEAALKSPQEIETEIAGQIPQIESMTGHSASQLSFLEKMIEQADDDVPEDLRAAYEEALLRQDRALGIEEANRGDLLNLPSLEDNRYIATLDYEDKKLLAIEAAREVQKEELVTAALGGVGTRLALLAGESTPEPSTSLMTTDYLELPAYFDEQAKKVQEIAAKRQAIAEKRLENFRPTYPEADQQTEAQSSVLVGIGVERTQWLRFVVDSESQTVNAVDTPEEIKRLLAEQKYAAVIQQGFNVITFNPMDQIDVRELLDTAISHYIDTYNLFPDEE